MPLIAVTSIKPGEGKTGVAAAIARHYAYLGVPVQLVRAATGITHAADDAALFATFPFAPGSPATPVSVTDIADPGAGSLLVAEIDAAAVPAGAKVVLVARGDVPTLPAGLAPSAIVVTRVPASAAASLPAAVDGRPVVSVAEDRTLAGFGVDEAAALLGAETLVGGEPRRSTCDYLVVSPISADAGQPYFRRFASKAVVVRFDRTDMHLAALRGEPECLILTGGQQPSGYTFDAAEAKGTPVLLSPVDTERTVSALEGLFDSPRFRSERKLERMAALLDATNLFEALAV